MFTPVATKPKPSSATTTAPFFPFRNLGSFGADGLRFFKTYVCNTPILNSLVACAWLAASMPKVIIV